MEVKAKNQIAFYLTGRHNGSGLTPLIRGYRPALFARYADLTELRYDFPLLLNSEGSPERAILSLSGLVDEAVESLKDDKDRDRIARHGYELERELRQEVRRGGHSPRDDDFATLWNAAAARLAVQDATFADSAKRLWELFQAQGELADVEFALPSRVVRHVWRVVQARKARTFYNKAGRLLVKLHGILDAESAGSDRGRSPEHLRAGFAAQEGTSFAATFDFDAMSRILIEAKPGLALSEGRRRRIQSLIEIIEHQRFFPDEQSSPQQTGKTPSRLVEARVVGTRIVDDAPGAQAYGFVFYRCADALQAYKERHGEAIALLKALAIAELEVFGEYRESGNSVEEPSFSIDECAAEGAHHAGTPGHDTIFEEFGAGGLDAGLLAMLPEYLVAKHSSELGAEETLAIVEALSTGLPIRILIQTDDLLEPSGIARAALGMPERHLALASRSRQMLDTAIGLNDVFVLQSSASELFRLRDALLRGMSYNGPAFFSIFSGSTGHNGDVSAYLVAAAAVESRAFPTIIYDPSAGSNWAARLQLDQNPDAEDAWPVHPFEYENEAHETKSETLAFTLADFIAMDDRFCDYFAIVHPADWSDAMIQVPQSLELQTTDRGRSTKLPSTLPYITLVDSKGRLQRAIVSRRALEETRRSQSLWHSLQELGGIHNSYAERRLEQLKAQLAAMPPATQPIAAAVGGGDAVHHAASVIAEVEVTHGDDPYIETARCTTCNECTQVNSKMFAYNGEKQAYIADASAGTFRQLVEAAEGCQVSIIHPGKPRNPKEAGLDELMKRAEPFN